jgi:hypothetical protein
LPQSGSGATRRTGSTIKTVALLPPSVKVYELSAGGTRERMDEWSEIARHNVVAAISKQLTARGPLAIKPFVITLSKEFGRS